MVTSHAPYEWSHINVTQTSKSDSEDDDSELVIKQARLPYQVFQATRQQQLYSFYLSEGVTGPAEWTGMIHTIRVAQPQDIIYIHLNTTGGRLDTGIQLINAMKDSQAKIVAVLDGKAFSLGTLIFLAADEFQVHDNCQFMIHNYSSGVFGKGNEQASELMASLAWFKKLAKKYYIPFLSPEELDRVLKGEDLWMESDEVRRRLINMVKIQQAEAEAKAKKPAAKRVKKTEAVELPVTDVTPVAPTETDPK